MDDYKYTWKTPEYKGVGVCGWMFLIFLTLKLTGHIAWSWWWVTAPLWIPFAVFLPIVVLIGAFWLIAKGIDTKNTKRFK